MAYKIPLFNLNFDEREAQAAYDTIKSGWISTGPKNAELEQMFIDMWKVKYAVSMSNCTDALHVCCMVCGFGPGDEVICPSLTFAASGSLTPSRIFFRASPKKSTLPGRISRSPPLPVKNSR